MTELKQVQLENLYLKKQLLQTQGQLLQAQYEQLEGLIRQAEEEAKNEPTTEAE